MDELIHPGSEPAAREGAAAPAAPGPPQATPAAAATPVPAPAATSAPAPHASEPASEDAPARRRSRGSAVLHWVLLAWGALLIAAVLAGVIGFLVHFFELQW